MLGQLFGNRDDFSKTNQVNTYTREETISKLSKYEILLLDKMESNQFSSSKILKHIDRINEWQKKGISRPITYELDMTNICNSKCHFCFGFFDQKNNQVSTVRG